MAFPTLSLNDWLDDILVRFLINLPIEELSTSDRILFTLEEAHWFYIDFLVPQDPSLPTLDLRTFLKTVLRRCHLFDTMDDDELENAYAKWSKYKQSVPVRGAIMLNQEMTHAVLVKGWKKGSKWSFPRGKINQDEDDLVCALRETLEETGFDLGQAGLVLPRTEMDKNFVSLDMRNQDTKLYIFRGVPMDTHFAPRARKEISDIQWFDLKDLNKKRKQVPGQTWGGRDNFYMVTPLMPQLMAWIKRQRKLGKSMGQPGGRALEAMTAGVSDTEGVEAGEMTADEALPHAMQPADGSLANLLAKLNPGHRESDSLPEVTGANSNPQDTAVSPNPDAQREQLMRLLQVNADQLPHNQQLQGLPTDGQHLASFQPNTGFPGPVPHAPREQLVSPSSQQPSSPHPHHGPVLHHFPPQHGTHIHAPPPPFGFPHHQHQSFPAPSRPPPPQSRESTGQHTPIPAHFLPRPNPNTPSFPSHAPHIPRDVVPEPDTSRPSSTQQDLIPKIHGPAITPTPKMPPPKLTPHVLGLLNVIKGPGKQYVPSGTTSMNVSQSASAQQTQRHQGELQDQRMPFHQSQQEDVQRQRRDEMQHQQRVQEQQQNQHGVQQSHMQMQAPQIPQRHNPRHPQESFASPQSFPSSIQYMASTSQASQAPPQVQQPPSTHHQVVPSASSQSFASAPGVKPLPSTSQNSTVTPEIQGPPAIHRAFDSSAAQVLPNASTGTPSPPRYQSPQINQTQPMQQPKPRNAQQDTLLALFSKASAPATASQTKALEPVELSANPSTPGYSGVQSTTQQAPPPPPHGENGRIALTDSFSAAKLSAKKPELTSATVSGPVNAPDFATVKKHSHTTDARSQSPTQLKPFVPQQILKREHVAATSSPAPIQTKKRISSPRRPADSRETAPPPSQSKPFRPQILKRPQPNDRTVPASEPASLGATTLPLPSPPNQTRAKNSETTNAEGSSVADILANLQISPAADGTPVELASTQGFDQNQAPKPSSAAAPSRGNQTATQKNTLLSLFSKPSPSPVRGLNLPKAPGVNSQAKSPIPPVTLPHPPSPKSIVSSIMSPVSPLPDKQGMMNSPNDPSSMSRSRISSIGDAMPSNVIISNDVSPSSAESLSAQQQQNGHAIIGLGGEEGYASSTTNQSVVGEESQAKTKPKSTNPRDKAFLLNLLNDFTGK